MKPVSIPSSSRTRAAVSGCWQINVRIPKVTGRARRFPSSIVMNNATSQTLPTVGYVTTIAVKNQ